MEGSMHRIVVMGLTIALSACMTQFYGSPKVDKGPAGCKAACDGWGMDLAGMVKMGEYSDGCICQVRPSAAPGTPGRSGASISAATGVYLQMQAAAAAAAANQQRMQQEQQGTMRGTR
jgi:hypothetical protein